MLPTYGRGADELQIFAHYDGGSSLLRMLDPMLDPHRHPCLGRGSAPPISPPVGICVLSFNPLSGDLSHK